MPILVDKKWNAKQLMLLLKRANMTTAMRARKVVLPTFKSRTRRVHPLKPHVYDDEGRYANANTLASRIHPQKQFLRSPGRFPAIFFRRIRYAVYRAGLRNGKGTLHNEPNYLRADSQCCKQRLSMRQSLEHFHLR